MILGDWAGSRVRSHADDDALLASLGDAPVIAIGEAGHGAREPLLLRNRIVRLLAARGELATVALETDMLAARALDLYVQGGPGDAEALAFAHLSYGFGALEDNVDLLRWMRTHNEGANERLTFAGFDIPGGDARGELGGARIAPRMLAASLRRVEGAETVAAARALDDLADRLAPASMRAMDAPARDAMRALLGRVDALVATHAVALDALEPDGHGWATRAACGTRAAFDFLCVWPELPADPSTIPDAMVGRILDASGVRDALMADHVVWLRSRLPAGRRLVVFAADGHVIAGEHLGGLWQRHPGRGPQLGNLARARLGRDYRVLVTVGATPLPAASDPEPGTLARAMTALDVPEALLDLDGAPPDPWLDAPQTVNTNGPFLQAFVPRVACDAIALFPTSTPAPRSSLSLSSEARA